MRLTTNHDVLPDLITGKRVLPWNTPHSISSVKHFALHLSNAYHTAKYVAVSLIAGIILKNISVRELHANVIRNLGRLTFSRKTLANALILDASK